MNDNIDDKVNGKIEDKDQIKNLMSIVVEEYWWARFGGKCLGKIVRRCLEKKVSIHPDQG